MPLLPRRCLPLYRAVGARCRMMSRPRSVPTTSHMPIYSAPVVVGPTVCVSYLSSASLSFFFGVMRFIHERDDWPLARANVVNVLSQTTLQMPILASTGLNAFVLWDSDRCPIRSWRRRRGKCPRLWHRRTVVALSVVGVDPAQAVETGEVAVEGAYATAVLDGEDGQVGVCDEVTA